LKIPHCRDAIAAAMALLLSHRSDYKRKRPMQLRPSSLASFLLCVIAAISHGESPSYKLVPGFPHWPPGMRAGAVAGVATDAAGNVIVAHRAEPPIVVFTKDGEFIRAFGKDMFNAIHGTRVDPDGNLWVTDMKNHTAVKFSLDGRVLLKLGERDVAGDDERHFNRPTDVATATNGDLFVSDGYGNARVVKFDKSGRFLLSWGRKGTRAEEFHLPHSIVIDRAQRLYVGDRENNRIQVFDANGKFLRQFGGFAPYGLCLDAEENLFVADGRANRVLKMSADGTVLATWGTRGSEPGRFKLPHSIAVSPDGAVYVAEVDGQRVQKFAPE
jgi:DNA-binding beta-propeller fold protein YncE